MHRGGRDVIAVGVMRESLPRAIHNVSAFCPECGGLAAKLRRLFGQLRRAHHLDIDQANEKRDDNNEDGERHDHHAPGGDQAWARRCSHTGPLSGRRSGEISTEVLRRRRCLRHECTYPVKGVPGNRHLISVVIQSGKSVQ